MMPETISGHAIVVGVGSDLPITVQDATAMAGLLGDPARCAFPADQVHLLTETGATRISVLTALDNLAQNASSDSVVIVYFSGHGYQLQSPDQLKTFYLMPYGYNIDDLSNTAINEAEFTAKLRTIKAKRLLVLLDCCHAGGIGQPKVPGVISVKSPLPPQATEILMGSSGRVIIASSRADEYSFTNSPYSEFTIALLEALSGAGAAEQDGYARVLDVALYVGRMVPNRTADKQHPILKVANLENNFALAYYAGGAKELLPLPQFEGRPPPSPTFSIETELATGYREVMAKYRHNLLEIELAMAEFIDQRAVPPDLLHAREGVLQKLTELEQKVS
jgi:hypothetical protein